MFPHFDNAYLRDSTAKFNLYFKCYDLSSRLTMTYNVYV